MNTIKRPSVMYPKVVWTSQMFWYVSTYAYMMICRIWDLFILHDSSDLSPNDIFKNSITFAGQSVYYLPVVLVYGIVSGLCHAAIPLIWVLVCRIQPMKASRCQTEHAFFVVAGPFQYYIGGRAGLMAASMAASMLQQEPMMDVKAPSDSFIWCYCMVACHWHFFMNHVYCHVAFFPLPKLEGADIRLSHLLRCRKCGWISPDTILVCIGAIALDTSNISGGRMGALVCRVAVAATGFVLMQYTEMIEYPHGQFCNRGPQSLPGGSRESEGQKG